MTLDALQPGECLFHTVADRRAALQKSAYTRYVKTVFKAHSGVALSPKDCRSSFVMWMRDGDHDEAALRAAAKAMRHSSTMASSAHYDKHGTDRVVAAAVRAAEAFADRYTL
ncbi:hypothetical protein OAO87_02360 [bacterium]|nr:hypothetical protein [bacterium]